MKKSDRDLIFNKYGGKCAYCGCVLQKGWHVDEIEPVRRGFKYDYSASPPKKIPYVEHPERFNIDNQNPACASCNINKHSSSLEDFRQLIQGFMKHLNEVNTQYKIAKRYGLVTETNTEVKFYFEKLNQSHKGIINQ